MDKQVNNNRYRLFIATNDGKETPVGRFYSVRSTAIKQATKYRATPGYKRSQQPQVRVYDFIAGDMVYCKDFINAAFTDD